MSHSPIDPAILYWGTPVILITSTNEDGSSNIAPISSAFWLGDRCIVGVAAHSKTTKNLCRTRQCVLNLPSDEMSAPINALARTTGSEVVPERKQQLGYKHVKDKFGITKLTPMPSDKVIPPRIQECPVQMEAEMCGSYEGARGFFLVIEVRIVKTWVVDAIRLKGHANRIDPDAWRPMIMSFQHLYGLRDGKRAESTLARIEEELYRVVKPSDDDREVSGSGPVTGA